MQVDVLTGERELVAVAFHGIALGIVTSLIAVCVSTIASELDLNLHHEADHDKRGNMCLSRASWRDDSMSRNNYEI